MASDIGLEPQFCDDGVSEGRYAMTTVGTSSIEELHESDDDDGPSDEEGDSAEPGHSVAGRATGTLPNGVWFGPQGSEATERELVSFLASHNGVAVLQWPRDVGGSTGCVASASPVCGSSTMGPPCPLPWTSPRSGFPSRRVIPKSTNPSGDCATGRRQNVRRHRRNSRRTATHAATRTIDSLAGALHQLQMDVNALGLEAVPATEHAHLIRRCR